MVGTRSTASQIFSSRPTRKRDVENGNATRFDLPADVFGFADALRISQGRGGTRPYRAMRTR